MAEQSFMRAEEVAQKLGVSRSCLDEVEQQATALFLRLVKKLSKKEM